MPYAQIDDGIRLYYELTGPEDAPVDPPVRRRAVRPPQLRPRQRRLPRAASGCSRSTRAATAPRPARARRTRSRAGPTTARRCSTRVGLDRVLVHGTSMGGMIAIAFTATHRERTIAACADVAFAKPDVYRRDAVPRLAADGRDDALGRLLRPRHDAGGRRRSSSRARRARTRSQLVRVVIGAQRPVHRAPGVPRDGGDGPLAARPGDRAAAADDERDARHPLPARARAVAASAPGRWRS